MLRKPAEHRLHVKTPIASVATQILPAAMTDLPAIAALAEIIWREHYPEIISREQIEYMLGRMYSLNTMQQEVASGAIDYVRLLVGTRLVGFAAFGPTETPGVFKLHKCYLLPEFHGRGYGSLLLKHCARAASKHGARRIILAVNKQNTKAIAAYQRNGFSVAQAVVTDFGAGFVMDDYIMLKELTPAAPGN